MKNNRKKLTLLAATAVTILAAAGAPIHTLAASPQKAMSRISWRDCIVKVITLPDYCLPDNGFPNLPEWPDTEIPDIEVPGDTPDAELPDTEEPGTDTPEEKPGGGGQELSYEEQVVELVNAERAREGLSALAIDEDIEAAGLVRAKEIVSSFSHTRPNGTGFATALREQGVTYRVAGENIAWGQKSPEAVVNAWMNSEGHRANIMNSSFTRIGVGHYQNGSGTNYWVQLFAF